MVSVAHFPQDADYSINRNLMLFLLFTIVSGSPRQMLFRPECRKVLLDRIGLYKPQQLAGIQPNFSQSTEYTKETIFARTNSILSPFLTEFVRKPHRRMWELRLWSDRCFRPMFPSNNPLAITNPDGFSTCQQFESACILLSSKLMSQQQKRQNFVAKKSRMNFFGASPLQYPRFVGGKMNIRRRKIGSQYQSQDVSE